jgi:hypothetical protein
MFIENEDDEQKKQQGISIGSGGGAGILAGEGNADAMPLSTPSSPVAQKTQAFGTVQDYLNANQTQANDLGGKVQGQLQTDFDTSKQGIDTAAEGAVSDIQKGTTAFDPTLTNEALSTPTEVANDPTKAAAFKNQWNASYKGPDSFEASNGYSDAAKAVGTANTRAEEIKDFGGREQLLTDQFGVKGQGNKGLDAALLQTSSAEPTLQAFVPKFQSVNDYLASKSADLGTQAKTAQTATNEARSKTQDAFANKLTDFQNDLNGRVTTAQNTANAQKEAIKQDLASGDVNRITSDLNVSGASPEQIQSIQAYLGALSGDYATSPDLAQFNDSNPAVAINPANVATSKDYANAKALSDLTGTDYSGVLNPANAGKAETAPRPTVSAQNISSYLKSQMDANDKAVLSDTRPLAQRFDMNNPSDAARIARAYIHASERSGVNPADNPNLRNLVKEAVGNGHPLPAGLKAFLQTLSDSHISFGSNLLR